MAPYIMFFADGVAYHMEEKNWNIRDIVIFAQNYTEAARWKEPIRRARNSLNIFIEYACKDVANNRQFSKLYNHLRKDYNETSWFKIIFAENFSNKIPRKT